MRVIILPNAQAVSIAAADEIEQTVRGKPNAVLGLATGGTPTATYAELIRRHREGGLSFADVTTFNLDEYVGLPQNHPQSYRTFMNVHLFQQIDIPLWRTHVPRGDVTDLVDECLRYEHSIEKAGGIDLQLLGIGRDGHIGFNEPGSSLGSRTRIKTLAQDTIEDNARFFETVDQVPRVAITMGVGTIMQARRILLIACGEAKAEAVQKTIEGPLTAMVTASALQWHPEVVTIIDESAASQLARHRDYRRSEEIRRQLGQPSQ